MPRKSVAERFQGEDLYFLSLLSDQETIAIFSKIAQNFTGMRLSATAVGLHIEEGGVEHYFRSVRCGQIKADAGLEAFTVLLLACQRASPHGFVISFPDGERIHAATISREMLCARHQMSMSKASELMAAAGLIGQASLSSAVISRSRPSLMNAT